MDRRSEEETTQVNRKSPLAEIFFCLLLNSFRPNAYTKLSARRGPASLEPKGEPMNANEINLPPASLETFLEYANDAANWSFSPLVSTGNVHCTKAMRGNLADLVKKGLIEIEGERGDEYVWFTDAGIELALAHGCDEFKDIHEER